MFPHPENEPNVGESWNPDPVGKRQACLFPTWLAQPNELTEIISNPNMGIQVQPASENDLNKVSLQNGSILPTQAAYTRYFWSELQPKAPPANLFGAWPAGTVDFSKIELELDFAAQGGRRLGIRVMPFYTEDNVGLLRRRYPGVSEERLRMYNEVPEWLTDLVPGSRMFRLRNGAKSGVERWVPDITQAYCDLIYQFHKELASHFNGDERLDFVDVGMVGDSGHFEPPPSDQYYKEPPTAITALLENTIENIIVAWTKTPVVLYHRMPFNEGYINGVQNTVRNGRKPGYRSDGWGKWDRVKEIEMFFTNAGSQGWGSDELDFQPMVMEWWGPGPVEDWVTDPDPSADLDSVVAYDLQMLWLRHTTHLFPKGRRVDRADNPAIASQIFEHFAYFGGYRIVLRRLRQFNFLGIVFYRLTWENQGMGFVPERYVVAFRYRPEVTSGVGTPIIVETDMNPSTLVPADSPTIVFPATSYWHLSRTLPSGPYSVDIGIVSRGGQAAEIRMAIEGAPDDSDWWYPVARLQIR